MSAPSQRRLDSMAFPTNSGDAMTHVSSPLNALAQRKAAGFTLIELLVVMAILALLLSIAAPRYFESLDRAKEVALQTDLRLIRESIEKFRSDRGRLPDSLQQLVDQRYLRTLPSDPVTDSVASWTLVAHPDGITPGVYDVRSGAAGQGRDGTLYANW